MRTVYQEKKPTNYSSPTQWFYCEGFPESGVVGVTQRHVQVPVHVLLVLALLSVSPFGAVSPDNYTSTDTSTSGHVCSIHLNFMIMHLQHNKYL
jgi:hypothetical protein